MNPFAWAAIGQAGTTYTEAMRQLEDRKLRKQQQDEENRQTTEDMNLRRDAAALAAHQRIQDDERHALAMDTELIAAYKTATAKGTYAKEKNNPAEYEEAASEMATIWARMSPVTQRHMTGLLSKFTPTVRSPEQEAERDRIITEKYAKLVQSGELTEEAATAGFTRELGHAPFGLTEPRVFGRKPATEAQTLVAEAKATAQEATAKREALTRLRLEGNDLRKTIAEAYARPANAKTVDADTRADRQRLYEIVRYKLPLNDPDATPDKPMPAGWGRRATLSGYQERLLNIQEGYYGLAEDREARMGQAQSFNQALELWRAEVDAGKFDYQQYRDRVTDTQWAAEREYQHTRDADALYRHQAELRYRIQVDLKAEVIDQETADELTTQLKQPFPELPSFGVDAPPRGLPAMPGIDPFEFGQFGPGGPKIGGARRARPGATGAPMKSSAAASAWVSEMRRKGTPAQKAGIQKAKNANRPQDRKTDQQLYDHFVKGMPW